MIPDFLFFYFVSSSLIDLFVELLHSHILIPSLIKPFILPEEFIFLLCVGGSKVSARQSEESRGKNTHTHTHLPSLPHTHTLLPFLSPSLTHTLSLFLSQAFKDGQVQFLICTDLAARGIDVKGLPYVINMTLPDETDTYFHRIGTKLISFTYFKHLVVHKFNIYY